MADLTVPVDPSRDHVLGAPDAAVTLVEYGDYQCPHCAAAQQTIAEVRDELGDDVAIVFRHLPIPSSHPHAEGAARAAEAAARQGAFWELHERLFQHADELHEDGLVALAEEIGLDLDRFRRDLDDPALARRVDEDVDSALRSGAAGTPSFFVDGVLHRGPATSGALVSALRDAMGADHAA